MLYYGMAWQVVRESERVWAKTEAWVEAEIQAEEAAWNAMHCLSSVSSGASTPRRWSGDGHFSHSIFGLEVEVSDPVPGVGVPGGGEGSGVSAGSGVWSGPSGNFSPKRNGEW